MGEGRARTGADIVEDRPGRDVAALSFEDALQELEEIVKALEAGRGTLAQAIEQYERGSTLRKHCESKLSEAEAKVQAIVDGPNGPTLRDVE